MPFWANCEATIPEATIPGCSIQSSFKQLLVYFKFILVLSGDLNLNPGPITPKRINILWEILPFHNCRFSTKQMVYQLNSLSVVSDDACKIFQKRGMNFIHLNINSLLSKIDEIRYIAKLTNATVIGLRETKRDNTVLSSELEIKGYDLARSWWSQSRGGVACFVKNSISYNRKTNFCIDAEIIFVEIFLPKFKPFLIGTLYILPDKYDFVNCLEHTFSDTNVFESQECYLLGGINIKWQLKDKDILDINPQILWIKRCLSFLDHV